MGFTEGYFALKFSWRYVHPVTLVAHRNVVCVEDCTEFATQRFPRR